MKFTLDIKIGKRTAGGEKEISQEVLENPFLLGLFVSSVVSTIRDSMISEFKKLGYEVTVLD